MTDNAVPPYDAVAGFEVALSVLTDLIALASAPGAPVEVSARLDEWVHRRASLTWSDNEAVHEILHHDAKVLRNLLRP
ncbi:hypothetical protein ACFROC_07260 [Nocardia tengchongensis]|uniref:hypothetical protein n=1 Tax=Nocardia tengchongensis TaxID=2055889 RepID=UPI0036C2B936